jgi:hypothetical protein
MANVAAIVAKLVIRGFAGRYGAVVTGGTPSGCIRFVNKTSPYPTPVGMAQIA